MGGHGRESGLILSRSHVGPRGLRPPTGVFAEPGAPLPSRAHQASPISLSLRSNTRPLTTSNPPCPYSLPQTPLSPSDGSKSQTIRLFRPLSRRNNLITTRRINVTPYTQITLHFLPHRLRRPRRPRRRQPLQGLLRPRHQHPRVAQVRLHLASPLAPLALPCRAHPSEQLAQLCRQMRALPPARDPALLAGRRQHPQPAVDTEVGTGHLPSLWAIRFVTPNPSLCDLNIGLAMDWERVQSLFPAHLALHAGMILFHPDADGPDWPHRQVTVACRHPTPDVENMRPCCVPEGCGSALDGKRRGTPARAQALLRRAEVAVCREDPARYPERSF